MRQTLGERNRAAARRIAFALLVAAPFPAAPQAAVQKQAIPARPVTEPVLAPAQKARLAETDELQTAVVQKDAATVSRLIARGVKPDFNFDEAYRGRSSESPLTMAIGRGHLEIARILLEAGADPNRRDGFDQSPMSRARSAEAVELLLSHGADINAFDRRGMTALELAIERRDPATAQMLVAHGARLDVPRRGPDIFTMAAERGDRDAIRTLLAAGADPRDPPTQAIWTLIEKGDDGESAKLLLDKGADPNASNGRDTLVERALFRRRWNILQSLADAGANLQPADGPACRDAMRECHSIEAVRLATLDPPTLAHLKARGLDLDRAAVNGLTALNSLLLDPPGIRVVGILADGRMTPALEPPQELPRIRALLEQGADPNRRFREFTPLMLAVGVPQKPPAIADALVDFGARVEFEHTIAKASPDERPKAYALPASPATALAALGEPIITDYSGVLRGRTVGPLTWLVLHRRADLASRILARDRKLPASDRYLLYFAAGLGQWDLVLQALPYVRDVDAGDRAGVTPLLIAADDGHTEAVKALIAAGADVNVRSDKDWPPIWETPPSMLFMGHSPSKPRLVGGYTPLKAAKERKREEVVRILVQTRAKE